VDIAGVTDPEVIRRVSHLVPDVEEIGALLLAARKRVGRETKRLSRCPASPHCMREQRQVPTGVPGQVLVVFPLLRDLIAVPAGQAPQPPILILLDLAG
jgi:hypothetical protein